MYFYGFSKTVLFLTWIPLILFLFFLKITHTLSVFLPTSIDAFWKNLIWAKPAIVSHHLKIKSLSLEKDLTTGMFTIWESFFSNHKSEVWILRHIPIYFPKFLQSWKTTKYHFYINALYLQDIFLTCNIRKHLWLTHFYNFLGTFINICSL